MRWEPGDTGQQEAPQVSRLLPRAHCHLGPKQVGRQPGLGLDLGLGSASVCEVGPSLWGRGLGDPPEWHGRGRGPRSTPQPLGWTGGGNKSSGFRSSLCLDNHRLFSHLFCFQICVDKETGSIERKIVRQTTIQVFKDTACGPDVAAGERAHPGTEQAGFEVPLSRAAAQAGVPVTTLGPWGTPGCSPTRRSPAQQSPCHRQPCWLHGQVHSWIPGTRTWTSLGGHCSLLTVVPWLSRVPCISLHLLTGHPCAASDGDGRDP